MRKVFVLAVCVVAGAACASGLSPEAARSQVEQLITLYQENRPKFIIQKQEIIKADSCDRATALAEAIEKMVQEAALSPESNKAMTMVKMELDQAEKECKAK